MEARGLTASLSLFSITRRSVFSPRITTVLLLLSVLQLPSDVFFSLVELHAQEQNFILITEFLQALLCFISDAPDTVDHKLLFFVAATDPVYWYHYST